MKTILVAALLVGTTAQAQNYAGCVDAEPGYVVCKAIQGGEAAAEVEVKFKKKAASAPIVETCTVSYGEGNTTPCLDKYDKVPKILQILESIAKALNLNSPGPSETDSSAGGPN